MPSAPPNSELVSEIAEPRRRRAPAERHRDQVGREREDRRDAERYENSSRYDDREPTLGAGQHEEGEAACRGEQTAPIM